MTENEQEEQAAPLFRIQADRKEELITQLQKMVTNQSTTQTKFTAEILPAFLEDLDETTMHAGIINARLTAAGYNTPRFPIRFIEYISTQENLDTFFSLIEDSKELATLVNDLPTKLERQKRATPDQGWWENQLKRSSDKGNSRG